MPSTGVTGTWERVVEAPNAVLDGGKQALYGVLDSIWWSCPVKHVDFRGAAACRREPKPGASDLTGKAPTLTKSRSLLLPGRCAANRI